MEKKTRRFGGKQVVILLAALVLVGLLVLAVVSWSKQNQNAAQAAADSEEDLATTEALPDSPEELNAGTEKPDESETVPATEAPAESVTTEPTEQQTTEPEATEPPDTLSKKEKEALKEELSELFSMGSWYTRAVYNRFSDPRRVDCYTMFYDGFPDVKYFENDEQREQMLKLYPWMAESHTSTFRYPAAEMDKVLKQCFGLGLDEIDQRNLNFFYAPETDSYYHEHGDCVAFSLDIDDVRVLEDGRVLFTYTADDIYDAGIPWTVALQPTEDGYHILSNLPGEWTTAESAGALRFLNEENSAWQIDADAEEEAGVTELFFFESGALVYYLKDDDDDIWGDWWLEGDGILCCTFGDEDHSRFSCTLENGELVLKALDQGFEGEKAGTVIRCTRLPEEAFEDLQLMGVLNVVRSP